MKEIVITVSVLIICIMLIRHFFKGRIGNRLQYALWLLVAVRLIVPISAQLYLSLGEIDAFRIMDLVNRLEDDYGDITQRLEQPFSFTMNLNSLGGAWIAEKMLGEDMSYVGEADGPTSIFLAGSVGFTWLDLLRWIWFGGMGLMAVWMVAVNLRFWRKLRRERREFLLPEEVTGRLHPKVLTEAGFICWKNWCLRACTEYRGWKLSTCRSPLHRKKTGCVMCSPMRSAISGTAMDSGRCCAIRFWCVIGSTRWCGWRRCCPGETVNLPVTKERCCCWESRSGSVMGRPCFLSLPTGESFLILPVRPLP